jgi:hypothetical protein
MLRMLRALARLFIPRVRWLVPATLTCPHCGGAMQRGRVPRTLQDLVLARLQLRGSHQLDDDFSIIEVRFN